MDENVRDQLLEGVTQLNEIVEYLYYGENQEILIDNLKKITNAIKKDKPKKIFNSWEGTE